MWPSAVGKEKTPKCVPSNVLSIRWWLCHRIITVWCNSIYNINRVNIICENGFLIYYCSVYIETLITCWLINSFWSHQKTKNGVQCTRKFYWPEIFHHHGIINWKNRQKLITKILKMYYCVYYTSKYNANIRLFSLL